MSAGFKVFHARYRESGSWGYYQDYDCVVVAENESRALTWVVMQYPDTRPARWTTEEIPTDKDGVTEISSASS